MCCGGEEKEEQGKISRGGNEEERNLPWHSASAGGGASVRVCTAVTSGGASERAGPCNGAVLCALENAEGGIVGTGFTAHDLHNHLEITTPRSTPRFP